MFLIRSIAQALPGRRDEAVGFFKEFHAARNKDLGLPVGRVLTGSIGPSDSTVVSEAEVATLADFEAAIEKTNKWPPMSKYGPKFAELFVPGSHRFEIYRICK
jgi:hypothetical protein